MLRKNSRGSLTIAILTKEFKGFPYNHNAYQRTQEVPFQSQCLPKNSRGSLSIALLTKELKRFPYNATKELKRFPYNRNAYQRTQEVPFQSHCLPKNSRGSLTMLPKNSRGSLLIAMLTKELKTFPFNRNAYQRTQEVPLQCYQRTQEVPFQSQCLPKNSRGSLSIAMLTKELKTFPHNRHPIIVMKEPGTHKGSS